jgi:hypothetical protein
MPPKAAKEKKEKAPKEASAGSDFPPIPQELLVRHPTRWVQVHFKLLTSSLLDDVVRLPQTATLHTVEAHIVNHHGGGISRIMFWKDDIQPKTIQRDFGKTLKDVWNLNDATPHTINNPNPWSGLGGGVQRFGSYGEPEDHQVVLCYDYKPHDTDCPLLLRSPRYAIQGQSYGTPTAGFVGAADGTGKDATGSAGGAN